MEKLTEFLNMGGYAAFVWPAYAAAVVILGLMVIFSVRSLRKLQHQFKQLQNYET